MRKNEEKQDFESAARSICRHGTTFQTVIICPCCPSVLSGDRIRTGSRRTGNRHSSADRATRQQDPDKRSRIRNLNNTATGSRLNNRNRYKDPDGTTFQTVTECPCCPSAPSSNRIHTENHWTGSRRKKHGQNTPRSA